MPCLKTLPIAPLPLQSWHPFFTQLSGLRGQDDIESGEGSPGQERALSLENITSLPYMFTDFAWADLQFMILLLPIPEQLDSIMLGLVVLFLNCYTYLSCLSSLLLFCLIIAKVLVFFIKPILPFAVLRLYFYSSSFVLCVVYIFRLFLCSCDDLEALRHSSSFSVVTLKFLAMDLTVYFSKSLKFFISLIFSPSRT